MPQAQAQQQQPNQFIVSGHGTEITYSTTSISGQPLFSYKNGTMDKNFSGTEIRTEDSELGKLVTVSILVSIDVGYTSVTLLVPAVDLAGTTSQPISTVAIVCRHTGPIAPGHHGARQVYTSVLTLNGHANHVQF